MPQGSVTWPVPNINSTYRRLKEALDSAGEPAGVETEGLAIEESVQPSAEGIGPLLFRLLAKAPEQAGEILAEMGVGPEDFVVAIGDNPASEGLNFDVDQTKLSEAVTKKEQPDSPDSPVQLLSEVVRGVPAAPPEDAGPGGMSTQEPSLELESLPPVLTQPIPLPANPPPAQQRQTVPEYSAPPPSAPPAPASIEPVPAAPVASAVAPGAPPQPAYVPTASYAEGGSANTGVALDMGAAPVQQDALAQKANALNLLSEALEGVGDVGDPQMPEIATPGQTQGAGAVPRGNLLTLLALGQQASPADRLRLGEALALGR